MSRRWKIIIAAAILIGLALLYPMAVLNQAKSALAEYRKQLQAQGEKLTIAEVAPHPSAAAITAAQNLMGAIQMMNFSLTDYPPAMRYIAPGRAMVSWQQETLPTSESTNVWALVSPQVAGHPEELEAICAAAAAPDASFDLDYNQAFSLLLPHLATLKRASIALSVATLVELREGHPSNALEDLQACVALTRPLAHEPIGISQLVRVAIGQVAVGPTWELLQYPGWSDEQLAGLQTEWSSFNFLDGVPPSLEMERAFIAGIFEIGRGSISNIYNWSGPAGSSGGGAPTLDDVGQFLANPKDGYEAFMDHYPRYWAWKRHWSYVEELYNLQCQEATLDCARNIQHGGDFAPAYKKLNANISTIENLSTNASAHFYLGMSGGLGSPYLLKVADIEMERRMVVTAIALRRYQIQAGKYPADLKELVPKYLPELPMDLMDGKPLHYHPNADGSFLLYSVGEDGEDNGGDPTTTVSSEIRYPSWLKGHDAVWPMLAAPDEVEAYKEKLIAEWTAKQTPSKQWSRLGPPTLTPPVTKTN